MGHIEKTVFVSYRRTDESWGLAIFQNLTQHGYDVFIDYDGIASGNFEAVILENIRARAHFLVLLTPTALERCSDPKDWMRREIEAALDSQRNIVPLMLAGFDFGKPAIASQLTGRLATLKEYNGLEIPKARFFSSEMERLRNKFLNVGVDAVVHPASDSAQQVAKEQKDKATMAAEAQHRAEEGRRKQEEAETQRAKEEGKQRSVEDSEPRHRTQQEEPSSIVAHVVGSGATASSETSLLVPDGWFTFGSKPEQYDMGVDTQIAGSPAMIRCKYADSDPVYVAMEKGFGTLMQIIHAGDYRGTRLRLRAELKTDKVTGAGTIWMRVDGPGGTLQFDNMEKRKTLGVLKGTADWVPREIILDVPEEAESIHFGFYQRGAGATWARNFVLEQVDRDVPLTARMDYLDKATKLNSSFSNTRPSQEGEASSPRGKHKFKQSDITRALRATKAAGVSVSKIEIEPDGRMVIVFSDGQAETADDDGSAKSSG